MLGERLKNIIEYFKDQLGDVIVTAHYSGRMKSRVYAVTVDDITVEYVTLRPSSSIYQLTLPIYITTDVKKPEQSLYDALDMLDSLEQVIWQDPTLGRNCIDAVLQSIEFSTVPEWERIVIRAVLKIRMT